MKLVRRVVTTAAMSSNHEMFIVLKGATQVLAATNDTSLYWMMNTIAPYAIWLASAKQCMIGHVIRALK